MPPNVTPTRRRGRNTEKILPGPNSVTRKQLQYRTYMHDVSIYHFQAYHIPMYNFRCDEIPYGCIEVAYLFNVFQNGGSALGIRVGNKVVEWMCYDRDVKDTSLYRMDIGPPTTTSNASMLFEHVAALPRDLAKVRGQNASMEDQDWNDSLLKAVRCPVKVKVKLTWRRYGTALK
ncbi:hypothetical protein EJ02DRAFT_437690 [Clathrospora elynae]|uniref:Uncharacterized protein n=1 Tax=Clathrospora elynae TaxID=706981 RepID=A0A6A5SCL7_9PLEO|nr:hypothetical protein EJ02DRAFT_437690 [Clathrospora elynae]